MYCTIFSPIYLSLSSFLFSLSLHIHFALSAKKVIKCGKNVFDDNYEERSYYLPHTYCVRSVSIFTERFFLFSRGGCVRDVRLLCMAWHGLMKLFNLAIKNKYREFELFASNEQQQYASKLAAA